MRSRPLILIGLVLTWAVPAHAEQGRVTLRVSVDRTEVLIGEPIRYVMTLKHPKGMEVEFPSSVDAFGEFTIEQLGSTSPRKAGEIVTEERWYQLAIFTSGEHTIPEPVGTYRRDGESHEVRGQPVAILVRSLLPGDWQLLDIREAKPLLVRRRSGWPWLAIAWLALLSVAAGVIWWKRRRRPPEPVAPPRLPHELALEAMERLRQDELLTHAQYEEFYVRLSDIVRAYVEARFGLRAPEMTTEEFLQQALESRELSFDHRVLLQDFLTRCDLVKFAQYQPTELQAGDAFGSVERFVKDTVPAPVMPEPAETGAQRG